MPGFAAWIVSCEDLILSKLAWAKDSGSEMQDTTPEFRKLVEQGYASMAPEERVRVCTEMFDTAFALVEAFDARGPRSG